MIEVPTLGFDVSDDWYDDDGPWRQVREATGCSAHRAKKVIKAAREALPYPRTLGCAGETYGADRALVAGLVALAQ